MSFQRRRRGQAATVYPSKLDTDNRGNHVRVVDMASPIEVEAVFAIPGMGNLIVNAALTRDLPVVQGVVFVMVLVVIAVNLTADLLYTFLDPRIA